MVSEREEKERVSKIPGTPAFGRDPDDPTWGVTSQSYPDWSEPSPERKLALADAAFLEELSAAFLAIKVKPKSRSVEQRGYADHMTSLFVWRAERLHAIAQRLRGMQP
jgi:hypothetical protein